MSILNILREPNKLLRQKSAEINVIDEEIKNLAKDMLETMYNACLLYTSPSPRDGHQSRMPSSA